MKFIENFNFYALDDLKRLFQLFVAALLLIAFTSPSANAQFNIQIGGSEAEFKAHLAQNGFNRIDTVKLGLSESKFDACKGDKRYRVKFKWTGQTSQKVIGNCRASITQKQVRRILKDRGYRRINIEDRAGKFLAVGCLNKDRYRVEVNDFGDIGRERRIGSCQNDLSPADIAAKLEDAGFNRINFTDRQLPRYVTEACERKDRVELVMNRFGEIVESQRIGKCRSAISPDEITAILREKGYRRITLIDGQLPRYIAQACKKGKRFEVTMNRWGNVSNEVQVGQCRNAYSEEQIIASMRDNGYKNISIKMDGKNYLTRGCKQNRLNEIILTRFGELVSRNDLGSCDAPRINDLAETLRNRGLSKLHFFVEACRGNKKVRISFDEFANRTGRQVIGNC